jgi:3-hydroxyacyl-CoA dehydrogenase/enoyl-CoA hydratase/3-hydroxybutyryl-CoA epimerase
VYVVEKMAHGYKRAGRAAGGGFYDYTSQPPELWSGLKTFERRSRQLDAADIRDRLLYAAWLGALDASTEMPAAAVTQTFGETIATNASQARGQMQRIGAEAFLSRAHDLATRFGARFEPPAALTAGSTAA